MKEIHNKKCCCLELLRYGANFYQFCYFGDSKAIVVKDWLMESPAA